VEEGLEPEEELVSSEVVEVEPVEPVATEAALDTTEAPELAVADADTDELLEEESEVPSVEILILSYEPVSSPYVYEVAPVLASSIVTLLTYMAKGAVVQSVEPPAHSIVPALSVEAPPSQLPILTTIGVWGKLLPSLASS